MKLNNEEIQLSSTVRAIRLRRMRETGHAANVGEVQMFIENFRTKILI
jgi:hypothetical protein